MADTITRAIDIEVNIIHGDRAKRELGDVANLADKTSGASHKLVKELLDTAGGLRGVAVAAKSAGANLVPLEVVEDIARWFEKAKTAVQGFEAEATKTGKSAKSVAGDFAKMEAELRRLGKLSDYGVHLPRLLRELGESAEWLVPMIEKAREAGYEFTGQLYQMANLVERNAESAMGIRETFEDLDAETSKLNETTKDMTETTKEFSKAVEQETYDISELPRLMAEAGNKTKAAGGKISSETKKTGGMFNIAGGKALKFFGAIGVGVYSMYSLANALRRGARAVIDFVKGGIDLAVKAHKEWQVVISSSKKKLGELQKELGEKLLPQIGAVNVAQRELMDTLGDTGAIDSATRGIGTLALAWAGVLYAINECIKAGKTALDQVEEWGKKQGVPVGKIIRAGFAVGTLGLSEAVGPLVGKYAKLGKRSEAQAEAEAEAERARGLIGPRPPVKPWGYDREKEKPTGGRAPKRQEYLPSVEKGIAGVDILPPEELAAAESGLAMAAVRERHEEEREAKRKANREKEAEIEAARLAKIEKQAEEIGQLINPTQYLIEGLKSNELGKAAQEFGAMLGETVAAQMLNKLIMMGVMAILNMLTGGVSGGITSVIPKGQHGMYTGEYEGPVFVHKHEVIQPLDTYSQMSKLLSKAQPGIAPAAAGAGGGGGVTLNVSERAGDLVDVHRSESVFRGGEAISALEGA